MAKKMTETEIAYLAGLFDGEGCVKAYMGNSASKNSMSLKLSMSNSDPEPLELACELFGGSLRCIHLSKRNSKWSDSWCWDVCGKKAEDFARAILPYSLVKKYQLSLFLELRSTLKSGPIAVTAADARKREKLLAQIKADKR